MPHLFELLQNRKIDVVEEYNRLLELFDSQHNDYFQLTTKEILDMYIFRKLEIRKSFLNIDELFTSLELNNEIKYINNKLNALLLLVETLTTILKQSEPYISDININYRDSFMNSQVEIEQNIKFIVEKCNYELKLIDNWCWAFEKNKLTSQAVEFIHDEEIALDTIEYNHYMLKGNLDKKKAILLTLSHHIEPILKSKILSKNGYNQLESNVGFMLNNFNIRHNNKVGKHANEFINNIDKTKLEKWYDKLYNTILIVIVIEEEIDTNKEIEKIKKEYKFNR